MAEELVSSLSQASYLEHLHFSVLRKTETFFFLFSAFSLLRIQAGEMGWDGREGRPKVPSGSYAQELASVTEGWEWVHKPPTLPSSEFCALGL